MKLAHIVLVLVSLVLVAGCGDDEEATPTETETTSTMPAETTAARVYFVRDEKIWPAAREVSEIDTIEATMQALLAGPTAQEQADVGLTTAIPAGFDAIGFPLIADAPQQVQVSGDIAPEALAQLVYTATQFEGVQVEVNGRLMTRADFEDQTPAILVESPLAFEDVESPLNVTGTANTFEANFQYELTDTDGRIVDKNFVTATSGTGTRGTFDFTTKTYAVPFDGIGHLIVFESSAKDGSRINLVEIPLRMQK